MAVLHERFVQVQGRVQNQDGVVHLKAERVWPLSMSEAATQSHDSTDTGVSTMPGSPIRYAAIVARHGFADGLKSGETPLVTQFEKGFESVQKHK